MNADISVIAYTSVQELCLLKFESKYPSQKNRASTLQCLGEDYAYFDDTLAKNHAILASLSNEIVLFLSTFPYILPQ